VSLTSFIEIKGLTKIFGDRPALDNLETSIDSGLMVGLVGPDGSGKTTLLRLLIGLLNQEKGIATIKGLDNCKQANQIRAISGYMPQKFGLYEDLTVLENMNLYADLRNVDSQGRAARFEELLTFTGLECFKDRLAGRLSGGMKQKLGLACVLISTPELLLLRRAQRGG
jgi:ABC-2 type transport system ATP-binding protein